MRRLLRRGRQLGNSAACRLALPTGDPPSQLRLLGAGVGILGVSCLGLSPSTAPRFTYCAGSEKLNEMWNSAIEGMTQVPGSKQEVIYIGPEAAEGPGSPQEPEASSLARKLPSIFQDHAVFALTAYNPFGQERAHYLNVRANRILAAEIRESLIGDERPAAWWNSFGFHLGEKWREDGFCLAYPAKQAPAGKLTALRLARKANQKAIYEFHADPSSPETVLIRKVISCDENEQQSEPVARLVMLPSPPDSPLSRPPAV